MEPAGAYVPEVHWRHFDAPALGWYVPMRQPQQLVFETR